MPSDCFDSMSSFATKCSISILSSRVTRVRQMVGGNIHYFEHSVKINVMDMFMFYSYTCKTGWVGRPGSRWVSMGSG